MAKCVVCESRRRVEIEADIVALMPNKALYQKYRVSSAQVAKHKDHMDHKAVVQSKAEDIVMCAACPQTITQRVEAYIVDARRLLDGAERDGDRRTAITALRELVRITELLARLSGELAQNNVVNVQTNVQVVSDRLSKLTDREMCEELEWELVCLRKKLGLPCAITYGDDNVF